MPDDATMLILSMIMAAVRQIDARRRFVAVSLADKIAEFRDCLCVGACIQREQPAGAVFAVANGCDIDTGAMIGFDAVAIVPLTH